MLIALAIIGLVALVALAIVIGLALDGNGVGAGRRSAGPPSTDETSE